MGLKGVVKYFFVKIIQLLVVAVVILYIPGLPPNAKISDPYKVPATKPLEGKLALNNRLETLEKWHEGDLYGPEAFAHYNGELYTTLHGGDIVKLTGAHITPVVKIGKPCGAFHEEHICGRPLGLQFDKNGNLYVADPYHGLFKVNVQTGEKTKLVSVDQEIGGKLPKLPNSVALSSNGDIYWTDSTTEFTLQDGVYDLLADGSGRLIHYDAKTKKNTVLLPNLHFANGVALSDDETFVIVAETGRSRLHKYYISGPNKGKTEIFIDGLPGLPDNLKPDGKGGFIVPLVFSVDEEHPSVFQVLGPFPSIRKVISRFFGIIELGFATLNKYYPCTFAEKGQHFIGHFTTTTSFTPVRSTVLHISKNGEILDSIHANNKNIGHFSEAHVFKDNLYLGSPFNNYIGRIPLSKLNWEHFQEKVAPKPAATQPPKPTQAPTPKPVTQAPTPAPTQKPKQTPPPPQQKQTPPPQQQKQAPPAQQKQAPPAQQKQAPPAQQQQTPPPQQKPTQAPPTPKQTTQTPPQKPAAQQAPPTPKPNQQAPPKQAPPKPAATQQTPPKPAQQQAPPKPAATQQTTPPAQKQAAPQASNQQAPRPTEAGDNKKN